MAESAKKSSGPSRRLTWLWMILALVVVGGFLTWLGTVSEPTTVPVVEAVEDGEEELAANGDVVVVPRDTLAAGQSRFVGRVVRVAAVEATSTLGPAIFWGELGDPARQAPVLVRLSPEVAGRVEVQVGQPYTITGEVRRVTEAVVQEWSAQGEFRGEGEQLQATFADYYIEATDVRRTAQPAQARNR
jgi:hypothetical protein